MNDLTHQIAPFDFTGLDQEFLLGMYRRMLQAREFEEQLYYLFLSHFPHARHHAPSYRPGSSGCRGGKCIIGRRLRDQHTHRGHAHCVAKGVALDAMMAEMFAKRTGSCKGMGGSMHLCDFSRYPRGVRHRGRRHSNCRRRRSQRLSAARSRLR